MSEFAITCRQIAAGLEVEFFEDEHAEIQRGFCLVEDPAEGASGHYIKRRDKFVISLESSQLTDPMSLVATVAHELGHVRLLGEARIHGGFEDHEPLTDLLTVFFGLGCVHGECRVSFHPMARQQV